MSRLLANQYKSSSNVKGKVAEQVVKQSELIAARFSLTGIRNIPETLVASLHKNKLQSKQSTIEVNALFDGSSFATKPVAIQINKQAANNSYINCDVREEFFVVFDRCDIQRSSISESCKGVTLMVKLNPGGHLLGKVSIKLNTIKAYRLDSEPQEFQIGHAVMRLGLGIRMVEIDELPVKQVEVRRGQLENRKIIACNTQQQRKKKQETQQPGQPSLAPLPRQSSVIGIFENKIQEVSMSKSVKDALGNWRHRPRHSNFVHQVMDGRSLSGSGDQSTVSSSEQSEEIQKDAFSSTDEKPVAPTESLYGQQLQVKQLSIQSSIQSRCQTLNYSLHLNAMHQAIMSQNHTLAQESVRMPSIPSSQQGSTSQEHKLKNSPRQLTTSKPSSSNSSAQQFSSMHSNDHSNCIILEQHDSAYLPNHNLENQIQKNQQTTQKTPQYSDKSIQDHFTLDNNDSDDTEVDSDSDQSLESDDTDDLKLGFQNRSKTICFQEIYDRNRQNTFMKQFTQFSGGIREDDEEGVEDIQISHQS